MFLAASEEVRAGLHVGVSDNIHFRAQSAIMWWPETAFREVVSGFA